MKLHSFLHSCAWFMSASVFSVSAQSGGPFSLRWHTIDGGGGRCAKGPFAIHGTVGQPESGQELRNDLPTLAGSYDESGIGIESQPVYSLRSGFWAGVMQKEVGPHLNIALEDSLNRVILTWPYPSLGFVLEQTAGFNATNGSWAAVPAAPLAVGTNWQINIRTTNSARMFRLIKQ